MTIAFQEQQDMFKEWVVIQSGLPVQWRWEAQVWQAKTYVKLNIINNTSQGVDEMFYTEVPELAAGEDYVPTIAGNRQYTLTVQVVSRDQRPERAARYYLEKLRTSLQKPSVKTLWSGANVAWVTMQTVLDQDVEVEGRMESIAQLDIVVATRAIDYDVTEGTSWVETAEISIDYENGPDMPEDTFGNV